LHNKCHLNLSDSGNVNRTAPRSRHWTGQYRAWSAIHAWTASGVTDLRTNSHCSIRWICYNFVLI